MSWWKGKLRGKQTVNGSARKQNGFVELFPRADVGGSIVELQLRNGIIVRFREGIHPNMLSEIIRAADIFA
jgi:hypothetical protein